jgi:ubiquinone/menaquinone biosynthesis C-methylase UbiE
MTLLKQESSQVNVEAYRSAAVVAEYAGSSGLQNPEIVVLSRIRNAFQDKRILDIGIGGGRTTAALLDISDNYMGIDISPEMVAVSRQRYPSVVFEVCDAREMSRFATESVDLVVFSYNGIDLVGHGDRLRILEEIFRVLAQDGAFVFSSHNRRSLIRRPWTRRYVYRKAHPLRHPRRFCKLFIEEFVPDCCGHLRNRWYEMQTDEFAIMNDEAHHFTSLNYYITIERQISQARAIGFRQIEPVDLDGNWLLEADYGNCSDPWVYYLCHKGKVGETSSAD